jgi:hypothetical protein
LVVLQINSARAGFLGHENFRNIYINTKNWNNGSLEETSTNQKYKIEGFYLDSTEDGNFVEEITLHSKEYKLNKSRTKKELLMKRISIEKFNQQKRKLKSYFTFEVQDKNSNVVSSTILSKFTFKEYNPKKVIFPKYLNNRSLEDYIRYLSIINDPVKLQVAQNEFNSRHGYRMII